MSLWKSISGPSQMLLHRIRSIIPMSTRSFETIKHRPSPTCASQGKKAAKKAASCVDDHPKPRRKKDIAKTFPFYHLIKFKDECCGNPCIDKDFPSFDKCLYKESDKNKRKYQITWVECPPLQIKPKKICCSEKMKRPPIVRRKPKHKPDTACKQPCPPKQNLYCPRIKLPRCRPARIPPRCHNVRYPADCHKIKAPYPAFSECSPRKLRKKRRTECECLDTIPYCNLLRYLNRRLRQTGTMQLNPCQRP